MERCPRHLRDLLSANYADSLENPRWIYVAPNGDIFVSEANAKKKFVQKVRRGGSRESEVTAIQKE